MLHYAIEFAVLAHKDQTRKGTIIPYIAHPFEVASILMHENADENVVIAGLLHDTIEDTLVTADDIQSAFGDDVLELVQSNSEDKSKSWEKRKQHTIDYLATQASRDMALLALADKLSNLRSIAFDLKRTGEDVWGRFKRGRKKQCWYYKGLLKSLGTLSGTASYREYESLILDVFK